MTCIILVWCVQFIVQCFLCQRSYILYCIIPGLFFWWLSVCLVDINYNTSTFCTVQLKMTWPFCYSFSGGGGQDQGQPQQQQQRRGDGMNELISGMAANYIGGMIRLVGKESELVVWWGERRLIQQKWMKEGRSNLILVVFILSVCACFQIIGIQAVHNNIILSFPFQTNLSWIFALILSKYC